MPTKLTNEELVQLLKVHGSAYRVAKATGVNHNGLKARIKRLGIEHLQTTDKTATVPAWSLKEQQYIETDLDDGVVIVASDFHVWPGITTTAQRALLWALKTLKPAIFIANGDVFDGAQTSRFPSSEWNKTPTTQEELKAVREYMQEVAKACGRSKRWWVCGNHESRFIRQLAAQASAFQGVHGFDIRDHFPDWQMCYRVTINPGKRSMTDFVHNWANGVHAAWNNVLKSGVNYCTGHTHRLGARHYVDRRGARWACETGTLTEYDGPQSYYVAGRPTDWMPGFAVLTFSGGELLRPEFVDVIEEGRVSFRGKVLEI